MSILPPTPALANPCIGWLAPPADMKTLLLTGFGLWGEERYNSSWEIVCGNPVSLPAGWRATTRRLPVSWTQVPAALDNLLADPEIRAVVSFGMCNGPALRVERLAINLNDCRHPDADGSLAPDEFVVPGGPPAYWSGLDVAGTLQELRAAGIPATESRSAGGYLCNFTFYHLMHRLAGRAEPVVAGFIHVPHFEAEGGLPRELLRSSVPLIVHHCLERFSGH